MKDLSQSNDSTVPLSAAEADCGSTNSPHANSPSEAARGDGIRSVVIRSTLRSGIAAAHNVVRKAARTTRMLLRPLHWRHWTRRRVLFSFGFVALAIAVPAAWWSTCGYEGCPSIAELQAWRPTEGGTVLDANGQFLGAIVPVNGATWFFKLMGPDATVSAAKPAFLTFLQTVRAPAAP